MAGKAKPSAEGRRRRGALPGYPSPARPGGLRVWQVQRARMLHSAVQVVSELGYERMSVASVTGGAKVSRRTFYDVFEDREDCFLAAFDDALASFAMAYAEQTVKDHAALVKAKGGSKAEASPKAEKPARKSVRE